MSVLLLQLLFDSASVNLDRAQVRNVSACVGSVDMSLRGGEAVCNTASRLEMMETTATPTIANRKNRDLAYSTQTRRHPVRASASPTLQ